MTKKSFFLWIIFISWTFLLSSQSLKLKSDNIDKIVQSLTLEEKASLLVGGINGRFYRNSHIKPEDMKVENCNIDGAAGTTVAVERLGIPATVMADGPAGVGVYPSRQNDTKKYYNTGFPIGSALACSWNTDITEGVAKAIGNEVLEYGIDILLAPGMNLHRSPLCGRNFEYYSEDPLLSGRMAAAYVRGVQSNGVGATLKHFAVNSQETNRSNVDEVVSQRALRELYLKSFEIAVKESHPWAVMSSYNRVNGSYTQESYDLLTTILRKEWGYKGFVMTDWVGKRNTALQIQSGNDLMMPGQQTQIDDIIDKVKKGELSMTAVDACVSRVLEYVVKTPQYRNYKFSNAPDLKQHAAVARQAAVESMVLLKNDNAALPFSHDIKTVALFGISSYDFMAGGTGSGNVHKPYVLNLVDGFHNCGLQISENLKDMYESYQLYQENILKSEGVFDKDYEWGRGRFAEPQISLNCIRKQVTASDIAVITIGRQAGEDSDRHINDDFNLTDVERQILNDICNIYHAAHKKVIVVINSGGIIETASWKDLPDAILMAWQPGQEGANALADLLVGKENPSGKLAMTIPIAVMDNLSSANYPVEVKIETGSVLFPGGKSEQKNVDYTLHSEDIYVGYRYFNTVGKAVAYPFGYGLSYTQFEYGKPIVKSTKDGFQATVTIKNVGQYAGKEVVQLYVSAPEDTLNRPACELKSFLKTHILKPGESQTLTFNVSTYELASFYTDQSCWMTPKGSYELLFGASIEDIRVKAVFDNKTNLNWKVNDVLKPNRKLF